METDYTNYRTELELFILDRLSKLMKERNMTRYRLCKICGVTQASLSTILSGKCSPAISTIERICNGLDISVVDFFNTNKEVEYIVSNEDILFLKSFNSLNQVQKQVISAYIEGMLSQSKLDNK